MRKPPGPSLPWLKRLPTRSDAISPVCLIIHDRRRPNPDGALLSIPLLPGTALGLRNPVASDNTSTMKSPHLILASASPRRRHLLEQAGLSFDVMTSHFDEDAVPFSRPESHVKLLAQGKAAQVGDRHPGSWVIGADTEVVIGERVLGKPGSRDDARRMLGRLSGRTHHVYTGYCLYSKQRRFSCCEAVRSEVRFKELSDGEIEWYIRTDEPYDKAGAYAVQGIGAALIRRIEGSYTNVVGLPLCEVIERLVREGVIAFDPDRPGRFQTPGREG